MARLQAPLDGRQVTVGRYTYTTDTLGQISVARQVDVDALVARGWKVVPTTKPVSLDSTAVRWDRTTVRFR